ADGAGQVLDGDRDVVDVDLEPDPDDDVGELERDAGASATERGRSLARRPPRGGALRPSPCGSSMSITSRTRLETVPRVRPVSAAIRARDSDPRAATWRSTTPRLARRTRVWCGRDAGE